MYEVLLSAIKRRDEETVLTLLPLMDVSTLGCFDDERTSIANYLVKYGLFRALKKLKELHPLLLLHENKLKITPFINAFIYNQPAIADYFIGTKLVEMDENAKRRMKAFKGQIKVETVTADHMTAPDSAGFAMVHYAVAGGHDALTQALLACTPPSAFRYAILLKIAVANRHYHLLKLLVPHVTVEEFIKVVGTLLDRVIENEEDPYAVVKAIVDHANEEDRVGYAVAMIVQAIEDNYPVLVESLIKEYKKGDAGEREHLLIFLCDKLIKMNKRDLKSTYPIRSGIIGNMVAGFKEDILHEPQLFYPVCMLLMSHGYVEAIWQVLCQLSPETAIAAVTRQNEKTGRNAQQSAFFTNKKAVFYLLLTYGPEVRKITLESEAPGGMVEVVDYQLRLCEWMYNDHLLPFFELMRLFYQFFAEYKQTKKYDHDTFIQLYGELINYKSMFYPQTSAEGRKIIYQEFDSLLEEMWRTTIVFCKHGTKRGVVDKENLMVILKIAILLITKIGWPLKSYHCHRAANLAFVLGQYQDALFVYRIAEKSFYDGQDKKSPITISQIILTKLMLVVFDSLKVTLRPHFQDKLLFIWPEIAGSLAIADHAFLQAVPGVFEETDMDEILRAFPPGKIVTGTLITIPPNQMDDVLVSRLTMQIKVTVDLFYEWMKTNGAKVSPSVQRDPEKIAVIGVTNNNKKQLMKLHAFYKIRSHLITHLNHVLEILMKHAFSSHLTYKLQAASDEERKHVAAMNASFSLKLDGVSEEKEVAKESKLTDKEKKEKKKRKKEEREREKERQKQKEQENEKELSDDEVVFNAVIVLDEEHELDESAPSPLPSFSRRTPLLFQPPVAASTIPPSPSPSPFQPRRKRYEPTESLPFHAFVVPSERKPVSVVERQSHHLYIKLTMIILSTIHSATIFQI